MNEAEQLPDHVARACDLVDPEWPRHNSTGQIWPARTVGEEAAR